MTSDPVGSQWLRQIPIVQSGPSQSPWLPPRRHPDPLSTTTDHTPEPPFKRPRLESERATLDGSSHSITANCWPQTADQPFHAWSHSGSKQGRQVNIGLPSRGDYHASSKQGPPLLPQRPKRSREVSSTLNPSTTRRALALGEVQTKPYVADPPSLAPRFKSGAPADFHHWTGHHPEDVLNESTTKNGFYDKPPAVQNESTNSKPTFLANVKQKSGLQILSSWLVAILDQRQSYGVITAKCTFKPPPRVTLTDTKREAWLRDLSNPDIPLRRLSRTIPHGIRGKALLDHCLAKNIPIPRAIWLAKCVGANEIRAFKRKGAGGAFAVGGEAKWIKDWTANVEQFVESNVGTCGVAEWRTRVGYVLRLASHLASERLLDQGHYLNWIISSVQNSDFNQLCNWISIAQLHQDDLLQHRLNGRRFVEVLIEQLQKADDSFGGSALEELVHELLHMLKSIIVSHPACFLLPQNWSKYQALLRRTINDSTTFLSGAIEQISIRNSQLQSEISQRGKTPRQKVIQLLDSSLDNINVTSLSRACLEIHEDIDAFVMTCLQWGSSAYRSGHARIYLTARLLRRSCENQIVLDRCVLAFVATAAVYDGLFKPSLYRILAELFRSKHLSAGKCLQWLMARGGAFGTSDSKQHDSYDYKLLLEMPTDGLLSHDLNLRGILLSKCGSSVTYEQQVIRAIQVSIADQLPGLFLLPEPNLGSTNLSYDNKELSIPIKSTVAQWIKESIACQCNRVRSNSGRQKCSPRQPCLPIVTLDQLARIRGILETLEDYAILADVLRMVVESEDVPLLTYICDTVNYHLTTMAAIGALHDLFQGLLQQYENVCKGSPADHALLESLIDLGRWLPSRAREVRHLRAQRKLFRQKAIAPACSPVSDHMAELLQSTETRFFDEVEQVLASGTSMDEQSMRQLFDSIVKHTECAWQDPHQSDMMFLVLLSRLRSFNPDIFDSLVRSWINSILRSPTMFDIPAILPPVIYSGCVTLKKVVSIAQEATHDSVSAESRTLIAMDLLELLAGPNQEPLRATTSKVYRLRSQHSRILRQCPHLLVSLLLQAIEAYSASQEHLQQRAQLLILSQDVRDLVKMIAVTNPQALQNIGSSSGAAALIDKLLFHWSSQNMRDLSTASQLRQLLAVVDDFNMPLCQSWLRIFLTNAAAVSEDIAAAFIKVINSDGECISSHSWPELVSGLLPEHGAYIRQSLERELLSGIGCGPVSTARYGAAVVQRTLSVIDAIAVSSLDSTHIPLVIQIAEKFTAVLPTQILSTHLSGSSHNALSVDGCGISDDAAFELKVLLRLLILHQPTTRHPKFPQLTLASLLLSLSTLLISPCLNAHPILISTTNDLMLVLSDSLNEESRNRCVRTLLEHNVRDSRLRFIFGYPEHSDGEWLRVVTGCATTSDGNPIGSRTLNTQPYPVKWWEMMPDATPLVGPNDTSLSLTLFGTRKSIL